MGISPSIQALIATRDPDFRKSLGLEPLEKGATAADVHVSSTSDKKRKKPAVVPPVSDFYEAMGVPEPIVVKTFADVLADANGLPPRPSQVFDAVDKMADRTLKPHADGGAHVPFPYDANALGSIPDKHIRRYMAAVTNSDALPQRTVPINSLVAVQPRVSPEKVNAIRENGADKLPVVVRHNGKNLIADGTHRAAASYLDGETSIAVKYDRLSGDDEHLAKDHPITFKVSKADEDQQLIFGWASMVQKGDYLIVDKQGDMILPAELERAAYDYVLEARHHGDAHKVIGTGKLVESMVFTAEKQKALGVTIKDDDGDQVVGWWAGFKVNDELWAKHKAGDYLEFSIGGSSASIEIETE